jgi:hypothetical protein
MIKIKSLFQRNYDGNRQVRDEVVPGSEWVQAGEGVATRKYDGMAIKIWGDEVYQRYDAKTGRTPPANFTPAQDAPDPETGHWPGWVPVPKTITHVFEAIRYYEEIFGSVMNGTYEVCGPKVGTRHGANPENLDSHILCRHGAVQLNDCPTTFNELREYLKTANIEGVVWWHSNDGRMAKIKSKDFGIDRTHSDKKEKI